MSHFLLANSTTLPTFPVNIYEFSWTAHIHEASAQVGTGASYCGFPVGSLFVNPRRSLACLSISVFCLTSTSGGQPMKDYALSTYSCIPRGVHTNEKIIED